MGFFTIHLFIILTAFLWGSYNLAFNKGAKHLRVIFIINLSVMILSALQLSMFLFTRYSLRGSYDLLTFTFFISSGLILFMSTFHKYKIDSFIKYYGRVLGVLAFLSVPMLSWIELRHLKVINISDTVQLRKETSDFKFRNDRFKVTLPVNYFLEKNFLAHVYLEGTKIYEAKLLSEVYNAKSFNIESISDDTIRVKVVTDERTKDMVVNIFEMDGGRIDDEMLKLISKRVLQPK
ncbi:MAG: hypothetical protein ACK4ND_01250 [Cytophagaceae bacterium]